MVETAKYEVIHKDGDYEIRKYNQMIVATVRNTPSKFRALFNYISGSNKIKKKVAMTSPVITSEEISMTSPVLRDTDSMSFIIPSKYDIEKVPEPMDERVTISEVPERYIATIKFRGFTDRDIVSRQTRILLDWLSHQNLEVIGHPFLMQYNPPYVPGFLRRNEIGIEINYSNEDS